MEKVKQNHKIECPLCRLKAQKENEQKFFRLADLLRDKKFRRAEKNLVVPFGKTPKDRIVFVDFSKLPHLLIGGAVGSGKSVFFRSLIAFLIQKFSSEELRFIIASYDTIDFDVFGSSSYLLFPLIGKSDKFRNALKYLSEELERRYEILEKSKSRNIGMYNKKSSVKMPYIFLMIEELSAFFPKDKKENVDQLVNITQLGRGVGIHLVASSIKMNDRDFPSRLFYSTTARLAFQLTTEKESSDILNFGGAEKLQGKGDAFLSYCSKRKSTELRLQTPMTTKKDLKEILAENNKLKIKVMNENEKIKKEEYLMTLWWLHQVEQLEEKLTADDYEQINALIRKKLKEDPTADLWEISE